MFFFSEVLRQSLVLYEEKLYYERCELSNLRGVL